MIVFVLFVLADDWFCFICASWWLYLSRIYLIIYRFYFIYLFFLFIYLFILFIYLFIYLYLC